MTWQSKSRQGVFDPGGPGVRLASNGKRTVTMLPDGCFFLGSDIGDPVFFPKPTTTQFVVLTKDLAWNGENLGAGDVLIGNPAGANLLWDASAGQFRFRNATTVQVSVDTNGRIVFGGGTGRLDANGITVFSGANAVLRAFANGNFMLGSSVGSQGTTSFISFATSTNWGGTSYDAGDLIIGHTNSGNVFWDDSAERLLFRNGSVIQLYVDTDGSIKSGDGVVTFSQTGLLFRTPTGTVSGPSGAYLQFTDASSGNSLGAIYAFRSTDESPNRHNLYLRATGHVPGGIPASITLEALGTNGQVSILSPLLRANGACYVVGSISTENGINVGVTSTGAAPGEVKAVLQSATTHSRGADRDYVYTVHVSLLANSGNAANIEFNVGSTSNGWSVQIEIVGLHGGSANQLSFVGWSHGAWLSSNVLFSQPFVTDYSGGFSPASLNVTASQVGSNNRVRYTFWNTAGSNFLGVVKFRFTSYEPNSITKV